MERSDPLQMGVSTHRGLVAGALTTSSTLGAALLSTNDLLGAALLLTTTSMLGAALLDRIGASRHSRRRLALYRSSGHRP